MRDDIDHGRAPRPRRTRPLVSEAARTRLALAAAPALPTAAGDVAAPTGPRSPLFGASAPAPAPARAAPAAPDLAEPAEPGSALFGASAPAPQPFGPPPCPHCRAPGYLDRVDLARALQYQHCRACQNYWTTPLSVEASSF